MRVFGHHIGGFLFFHQRTFFSLIMIKLEKESLNSDVEQFHQSMSTKRKIQVLAWEGTNLLKG